MLHISSCPEEGGCLSPCSVQSTMKSSFCGCLRFRVIPPSLFFLVQLVGPVLGTSISRKSIIIGVYLSQFSRIAPFVPGHFREKNYCRFPQAMIFESSWCLQQETVVTLFETWRTYWEFGFEFDMS